ncbi:hypothetical protein K491DRAFT_450392 [Lophiostoma macrostomum CBS 122681]|uniref:Uncharacterized protein n=1 Tax=Lophiostoma macrostomum CBS 122681 TaxID=1314788 RepID=A0A6A6TR03_9PLEO|nr:hypothetical protein K491DRAFT_450392 [Lophiostoma macrostomum CBS 122681]
MSRHPSWQQYGGRGGGYGNSGPDSESARSSPGHRRGPAGREGRRMDAIEWFGADRYAGQNFGHQRYGQNGQNRQAYTQRAVNAGLGPAIVHNPTTSTRTHPMGSFHHEPVLSVPASTDLSPHQNSISYYGTQYLAPTNEALRSNSVPFTLPALYHPSVEEVGHASLSDNRSSMQPMVNGTYHDQPQHMVPLEGRLFSYSQHESNLSATQTSGGKIEGMMYNFPTNESTTDSQTSRYHTHAQGVSDISYHMNPGEQAYHIQRVMSINQSNDPRFAWDQLANQCQTHEVSSFLPNAHVGLRFSDSGEYLDGERVTHRSSHDQDCSSPSTDMPCEDLSSSQMTAKPDQGQKKDYDAPQIMLDGEVVDQNSESSNENDHS